MPAYDPISVDEDAYRSPFWGTFTLAKENIEGLVAVNLLWSVTLIPLFLAVGMTIWPLWVRGILLVIGLIASAGATGVLYGLVEYLNHREPLSLEVVRSMWEQLAIAGMQRLAPLFGTLGVALLGLTLANTLHLFVLQALSGALLLCLLLCSMYWGPLFAEKPESSSWHMLRRSFYFVSRYPGLTLLSLLFAAIVGLFGVVSLAGLFLIVPVLIAIYQTRRYQSLRMTHNH
ncbi:hypothetical protein [Tengunoibacter tsumagoiensis]|uniref:DUF624 domain-containing protein n=1 Tax=Tengunoibacter tsumagoiensis TaxID=2014871 RepID=A0A402A711_9CHLR|nr:hypothetical protein [Tengunoibacter tsumagoiensis]GCE14781.1 hypothetical protein KTT_46400 [Tengunoibacter tsumagoiensis]